MLPPLLGYAYDVTTGPGIGAVSAALIKCAVPPATGAARVAGCLVVVGAFGIESVASRPKVPPPPVT